MLKSFKFFLWCFINFCKVVKELVKGFVSSLELLFLLLFLVFENIMYKYCEKNNLVILVVDINMEN